jgi:hypothetical protein
MLENTSSSNNYSFKLLQQTLRQIEKDLMLAGFRVNIYTSDFNNYNELQLLIKKKLENQFNNKLSEIKRILYHLDLSNHYFEEFIKRKTPDNFDYLSEIIIKKCLYKVVLRQTFKG